MIDPVAYSFIGRLSMFCCRWWRVLPWHPAFSSGLRLALALNIFFTHIHDALQTFQCTNGSCCYAMLTGSVSAMMRFTEALRYQYLAYCIIYLMCTGMAEVFALQVNISMILLG